MIMSESYKTSDISTIDTAMGTSNIQSKTFYVGEKGDEIADYSYNYKLGTQTVKSTSVFYYGDTLRATDASVTARTPWSCRKAIRPQTSPR